MKIQSASRPPGQTLPCPVHCRGSTTQGCGSLQDKRRRQCRNGFRVSITIQQRRVGLWAWLGTGNKVPCMQQVPAIATQGKKRVGSSKCNPSRVFKKIKNLQQNPQRSRSVPDSDSRLARHDSAPGGWIGWGFAASAGRVPIVLSSTVLVRRWVGPEERIHPRNIVLGGAGRGRFAVSYVSAAEQVGFVH